MLKINNRLISKESIVEMAPYVGQKVQMPIGGFGDTIKLITSCELGVEITTTNGKYKVITMFEGDDIENLDEKLLNDAEKYCEQLHKAIFAHETILTLGIKAVR